jgi:deazaflavin-dependent oxidoreductase (nitroreductase family)
MRIPRFVYRVAWALDRLADRLTAGRWDSMRPGAPTLRLTTTGRKTGAIRKNALYYLDHAGGYAVVASNAGSDRDPAWWLNLRQHPEAIVRVGRQRIPVRARQATPEETARLWPRFDGLLSVYAGYRAQTDRTIPVVILERAGSARSDESSAA